MRNPLSFRFLPRIAFGLLVIISPVPLFAQVTEQGLSYPVGSVAMFPDSAGRRIANAEKIHLRSLQGRDARVWDVDAVAIPLPGELSVQAGNRAALQTGVGFIVPELPKGAYVAWYEAAEPDPSRSMRLEIAPLLLADEAIVRGAPGSDVDVRVHIFAPAIKERNRNSIETVVASVMLQSQSPAIADLSMGQPATVRTDREGFANWKVHLKNPGVVQLIASADGFDAVRIYVVAMPAAAPTFREAELIAAQARAEQARAVASLAAVELRDLEGDQLIFERPEVISRRVEGYPKSKAESTPTPTQELEKAGAKGEESARPTFARPGTPVAVSEQRLAEARARARITSEASDNAAAEVKRLAEQLPALQPPSLTEADLKPGDILLVYGSTPVISYAITKFEAEQLGVEAPYSHAAIYVGKVNGTGMVAEMLLNGFWVSSLLASTRDDYLVDVYRWEGIDDTLRRQIADKASHPYGSSVQSGSPLPYAREQIAVLVAAVAAAIARLPPIAGITQAAVGSLLTLADRYAGGRRKMICSEMVAWVYYDVGLPIRVKHWKAFTDNGLLTTEDRRKDYTTPNMLARSENLHAVGRLRGP